MIQSDPLLIDDCFTKCHRKDQGRKLILRKLRLERVPVRTFEIGTLLTLDLAFNELTALPGQLFESCELLQFLDISHNHIKHVPSNISNALALKKLNLSFNEIQTLPFELSQLPVLSELNLEHNQISFLEPSIR